MFSMHVQPLVSSFLSCCVALHAVISINLHLCDLSVGSNVARRTKFRVKPNDYQELVTHWESRQTRRTLQTNKNTHKQTHDEAQNKRYM